MLKIDIFTHILPLKYREALLKVAPAGLDIVSNISFAPTLFDLDHRFRIMDKFDGLKQVLTISSPPIEQIADSSNAVDLAKLANDELAELVSKYPDRFAAGVACLPMNNMDAALRELDRAVRDLNLKGVEVHTPVNDQPMDLPVFLPLYEKMAKYDLPIWIHPRRSQKYADYKTEDESKYRVFSIFGWPYETTVAMVRLVFNGVLEKFPNLKFITHHCGGMVPYFSERVIAVYERVKGELKDIVKHDLTKEYIEYFRMFYNDTAINGNTSALMCAYDFCGPDHLLFGTDMPFDIEYGERNLRQVTKAIEQMNISKVDKGKIFWGNAQNLLRLTK